MILIYIMYFYPFHEFISTINYIFLDRNKRETWTSHSTSFNLLFLRCETCAFMEFFPFKMIIDRYKCNICIIWYKYRRAVFRVLNIPLADVFTNDCTFMYLD